MKKSWQSTLLIFKLEHTLITASYLAKTVRRLSKTKHSHNNNSNHSCYPTEPSLTYVFNTERTKVNWYIPCYGFFSFQQFNCCLHRNSYLIFFNKFFKSDFGNAIFTTFTLQILMNVFRFNRFDYITIITTSMNWQKYFLSQRTKWLWSLQSAKISFPTFKLPHQ